MLELHILNTLTFQHSFFFHCIETVWENGPLDASLSWDEEADQKWPPSALLQFPLAGPCEPQHSFRSLWRAPVNLGPAVNPSSPDQPQKDTVKQPKPFPPNYPTTSPPPPTQHSADLMHSGIGLSWGRRTRASSLAEGCAGAEGLSWSGRGCEEDLLSSAWGSPHCWAGGQRGAAYEGPHGHVAGVVWEVVQSLLCPRGHALLGEMKLAHKHRIGGKKFKPSM